MNSEETDRVIYQGQFGPFTITAADRQEVMLYRSGLGLMALYFLLGTGLALYQPDKIQLLTPLYGGFCIALGISLATIHIYLVALHRFLQVCWGLGCLASLWVSFKSDQALATTVYHQPLTLLGVGFVFVALTGIFFKEAFCFNRVETKLLTPLVPTLLLGHLLGWLPLNIERGLLVIWAVGFCIFAARKLKQEIPSDIGDKSVFDYLKGKLSSEPASSFNSL